MKKLLFLLSLLALVISCDNWSLFPDKSEFAVSSPVPTEAITKVDLNTTEQGYVEAGNTMAFRFLKEVYDGDNLVLSPLSLQYALAMTANGAVDETLQEIIDFLGYGEEGIDILNAYCKKMLEQLPAVDLNVTLKLADALLINQDFQFKQDFKETVESNYYAPVESMDFSNPRKVVDKVNGWAYRNTNGIIDNVLVPDDLQPTTIAFLLNALYFKAKWAGNTEDSMFTEGGTVEEDFTLAGGNKVKVNYMQNCKHHQYAEMDGYKVLVLPYANGKFNMYVLLPDDNDLDALVKRLPDISWSTVLSSLQQDAEVHVKLPKFDIENKYYLKDNLKALGVKRAFNSATAQFDRMISRDGKAAVYIEKVIQKSKISVTEWGTEAAAVTVVQMGRDISPEPYPKRVYFYADHPFVFLIGEASSGAILFEGVYTGTAGDA